MMHFIVRFSGEDIFARDFPGSLHDGTHLGYGEHYGENQRRHEEAVHEGFPRTAVIFNPGTMFLQWRPRLSDMPTGPTLAPARFPPGPIP